MLVNIFGASPVQPLEKHMDLGHRATSELGRFFAAVIARDWDEAERIRDQIAELEREAEALKKDIRLHLPRSLFLPVPRQDILELLLVQDRIPDLALEIAKIVMTRRMAIPEAIAPSFTEFLARVIATTEQARKSIRELDELFSTGFRGAEAKLVESMIEKIDRIQTEADDRRQALMVELMDIEGTVQPVEAVFLYRVIDQVEAIADAAERAGRRLEVLLAH